MTQWVEQRPLELSPEQAQPLPQLFALRTTLLFLLLIGAVLVNRQVLWYGGWVFAVRGLPTILSPLMALAAIATAYCASITLPPAPMRHSFGWRIAILFVWTAALLGLAFIYDMNAPENIVKDYLGVITVLCLLLLGRRDEVWQILRKPLVVLFYVSLVLVLSTYRLPGAMITAEGVDSFKGGGAVRNLDTVGSSIRSIIDIGPLLFAWGMASSKKDSWRVLMILALPVYVFIDGVIFEFRGAITAGGVMLVTYIALTPVARARIPVKALIGLFFAAGIGFVIASQTKAFDDLLRRFDSREGIFDSRMAETTAFFKDMGPVDLLIGRGIAGTYVGPDGAPMPEYKGKRVWSGNHFGFLGFVRCGGVLLLLFVTTFAIPFFLRKPPGWYRNEYNLAGAITVPMLLVNLVFNPFAFLPEGFFMFLAWGLCFSRLSTPGPEQAWQTSPQSTDSES